MVVPSNLVGKTAALASSRLAGLGFPMVNALREDTRSPVVPGELYLVTEVPAAGQAVDPKRPVVLIVRERATDQPIPDNDPRPCGFVYYDDNDKVGVRVTMMRSNGSFTCTAANSIASYYIRRAFDDNGESKTSWFACTPEPRHAPPQGTHGHLADCVNDAAWISIDSR
jgi:hypothetical protein